jgi:hypothetical protein
VLDARTRERLRRGQLLSILLLGTLGVLAFLVPRSFVAGVHPELLAGELLSLAITLASAILNRSGRVTAAGALFVLGTAAAIALSLLASPVGLDMANRVNFHFFVIPIILAGIVLPYRALLPLWLSCAAFIMVALAFEPHQSDLGALIAQVGLYGVAISPIATTGVVALVSLMSAYSVEHAIVEADRTHELERAYALLAEQKRQLDEGVAVIQQVHAQAANGDLSARAIVSSGALAPLAISLNLMLERLARSRTAEYALGDVEQNIRYLEQAVAELVRGHLDQPVPQRAWGTLTPIALQLEQLRLEVIEVLRQATMYADHVRTASASLVDGTNALAVYLRQPAVSACLSAASSQGLSGLYGQIGRAEDEVRRAVEEVHRFVAQLVV